MDQTVEKEDAPLYCYQPLESATSIRILTLRPAEDMTAPVCCDLVPTELSTASPYVALSYSWGMNDDGDASFCRTIYTGGRQQAITRNLYEGLLRIRDSDAIKRLWIDAVCINQQDDEERTAQVQQMAKIYACATQVVVWLGEGESEEANQAIFCILSCFREPSHGDHQHCAYDSQRRSHDICALRTEGLSHGASDGFTTESLRRHWDTLAFVAQNFEKFATRRYFTRRWVVQELFFAHVPLLCWGSHALSLKDFERSLHVLDALPLAEDASKDTLSVRTAYWPTEPWRMIIRGLQTTLPLMSLLKYDETDLLVAVLQCKDMKCSDHRDYLYSLVSLDHTCRIVPDYTASTTSAYVQFAKAIIRKRVVSYLFGRFRKSAIPSEPPLRLPSWAPDLRMDWRSIGVVMVEPSDNLEAWVEDESILHCSLPYLGKIVCNASVQSRNHDTLCWQVSIVGSDESPDLSGAVASTKSLLIMAFKRSADEQEQHIEDGDELVTIVTHADSSQLYDMRDFGDDYLTPDHALPIHLLRPTNSGSETKTCLALTGFLARREDQVDAEWRDQALETISRAKRRMFEIV